MADPVVLLAGGTGGAKLARGLLDLVGEDLVVIANSADDVEAYGAYVAPDPDLVTFWLADRIDARGWGLEGDTFHAMDQLRELGEDVWFNLGDRDLAIGLHRARSLADGARLTEAADAVRRAFGVPARVLVPSDDPLRTWVKARGAWHPFQAFMVRERARGPIEDVELRGAAAARPAADALAALVAARVIVLGPSNPILSVDPILAVLGDAVRAAAAPVIAVSPLVGGRVLKGPTAEFLRWAGVSADAGGIAAHYAGTIDGLVADEAAPGTPTLETDVALGDADARRRVAAAVLEFAATLAR